MRTFTRDEIDLMIDMRSAGKSIRAISRAVRAGHDAVGLMLKDMPVPHVVTAKAETTLRGRNIMHLVDLKRAKHSRFRTEYNIPPDGGAPARIQSRAAPEYSLVGSSAAVCEAEWGFGAK